MSVRKTFRRLVTKEFMPHHDYGTTFEFRTVFYKSAFSYACCPCAFEHEFLLYIDRYGNINEDIYQKIEQSIFYGRCPHVDLVASEWIQVSKTRSLHIALAVGTEEIIKDNLDQLLYCSCGLFTLNLLDIAFMKTGWVISKLLFSEHHHMLPPFDYSPSENWLNRHLKYIKDKNDTLRALYRDSSGSVCCFTIKEKSVLEKVVGRNNETMLESILQRTYRTSDEHIQAIKCAIEHEKSKEDTKDSFLVEHVIESAVVYDQPELLEKIMGMVVAEQHWVHEHIDKRTLYKISKLTRILNRDKCERVFASYRVLSTEILSDKYQIAELLYLLKWFGVSCKDDVMTALRQFQTLQEECRDYIERNLIIIADTPNVVEEILNLGVDIPHENSLFTRLLQSFNFYYDTRVTDTIETLIRANPDLDQQYGVLELAFVQDELVYKMEQDFYRSWKLLPLQTGTYVTDIKEHGVFGHNDLQFALNFSGPFFLECGFPATMEQLEKALDKDLHPSEREYIKTNIYGRLEDPKRLDMVCRETLRKNFRGLKLHRFLEDSNSPKKIKDFIMLKSLLQPSQRNQ